MLKKNIMLFCLVFIISQMNNYVLAAPCCGYDLNGNCIKTCSNPEEDIVNQPQGTAVPNVNELPNSFFTNELSIITNLKKNYNTNSRSFANPYLQNLWAQILNIKNLTPTAYAQLGNDPTDLSQLSRNMDIYLADMIYAKITGANRQFYAKKINGQLSTNYVLWNPPILPSEDASVLALVTDGLLNFGEADGILLCYKNFDTYSQDGTRYLMKLCVLGLLNDTTYYSLWQAKYQARYFLGGVLSNSLCPGYGFAALKSYDNECLMLAAAVAFADMTNYNSSTANNSGARQFLQTYMPQKYSPDGGYSEGSHYLGFLNDVLLPFYYFGYKCGWIKTTDPDCSLMAKSGQWLLDIMDAGSGYVPEIADACGSASGYLLAPYFDFIAGPYCPPPALCKVAADLAGIYTDPRLKWDVDNNGVDNGDVPIDFLTYDPIILSIAPWWNEVYVHGGIGKINCQTDVDSISLTLITEKSSKLPDMTAMGWSHTTSDHGHIELRRTTNAGTDMLLLDPQYAGYNEKVWEDSSYSTNSNDAYANRSNLQLIQDNNYIDAFLTNTISVNNCVVYQPAYNPFRYHGIMPCETQSTVEPLLGSTGVAAAGSHVPWYIYAPSGGLSDIVNTYADGFDSRIVFDWNLGGYQRAVIEDIGTFYVFDRPFNNWRSYLDVHFNLPPSPVTVFRSNAGVGYPQNVVEARGIQCAQLGYPPQITWQNIKTDITNSRSVIRISAFCSASLRDVTYQQESFWLQDHCPAQGVPSEDQVQDTINAVDFETQNSYGTTNPPAKGTSQIPVFSSTAIGTPTGPNFISVLEPRDVAQPPTATPSPFAYSSQYGCPGIAQVTNVPGSILIQRTQPSSGNQIYAFVEYSPMHGNQNIEIPGSNFTFITDAEYGIVEINQTTQKINRAKLYNVSKVSYNCYQFALDGTINPEVLITDNGILNSLTVQIGSATHQLTSPCFQVQSASGVRREYFPKSRDRVVP